MKPNWNQNEGRRHEVGQWVLEADFGLPSEERKAVQQDLAANNDMTDLSWDEWCDPALIRDKFTKWPEKVLILQRTEDGFTSRRVTR